MDIDIRKRSDIQYVGSAISHHGEILQGVFERQGGKRSFGLVTLPINSIVSHVRFIPNNEKKITVTPSNKQKTLIAAGLTLSKLNKDSNSVGGLLEVESGSIEKTGMGSSTSDVVATINVISQYYRQSLTPDEIATISVEAEVASDSIMHERGTVLFAQREGTVIEHLGPLLPKMIVLSFELGAPQETCKIAPPKYSWMDFQYFKILLGSLKYSIRNHDLSGIARVATESAKINQKYLPKPYFNEVIEIASKCNAMGIQISHSGSVCGMIFDPKDEKKETAILDAMSFLRNIGINKFNKFNNI